MFVQKPPKVKFLRFCYSFEMQTKLSGTLAKRPRRAKEASFTKLGDTQPMLCAWHLQFSFV